MLCLAGTYYIDPDLPVQNSYLLKKSKKCCKRSRDPPTNALFKTKTGIIDLNLGIAGRPGGEAKANVQLVSRKGDIAVNLVCFLRPVLCRLRLIERPGVPAGNKAHQS
jgi:hypothetical protein